MSDKALSLDGAKTLYNDLRARIVGLDVGGETPTITVDSSLSSTSINPVENRVITSKVNEITTAATGLTSQVNRINERVVVNTSDIRSVTETVNTASTTANAANTQATANKNAIAELKTSVTTNATNITNLNTFITELNEEHDADIEELRTSTIDYSRITNAPTLAKVAETGSYGDLTNTPTLATVALSGNYEDLSTKPDIPILSSGIKENDSGYVTGGMVFDYITSLNGDEGDY